jgi:hypothetical protein
MAIVQRFFSTSSAGAADGTTWADRAVLFNGSNQWSTIITGFDFSGSDSLQCLIGPGNYACAQSLSGSLFSNPPTLANPIFLTGCDSSGVLLAIPDPNWTSAEPAWDDSTLPIISTAVDILTLSFASANTCYVYLLKFTATVNSTLVINTATLTWCVVTSSSPGNNVRCALLSNLTVGCVFTITSNSYLAVLQSPADLINCRVEGNPAASDDAHGVIYTGSVGRITRSTIVNNAGSAIYDFFDSSSSYYLQRCVLANNNGYGARTHGGSIDAHSLMVTGNGAYGLYGVAGGRFVIDHNRLRDNTSGNTTGFGNYPLLNDDTSAGSDGAEYVSAGANGDFRIKNTSTLWDKGYGVTDEPAAASASGTSGIIGDGSTW